MSYGTNIKLIHYNYLWFTMFFNPSKNATRKFNKVGSRNDGVESLKQIFHDCLELKWLN